MGMGRLPRLAGQMLVCKTGGRERNGAESAAGKENSHTEEVLLVASLRRVNDSERRNG